MDQEAVAATTLSDRIKLILAETGIRQADFARSLGISANYVYLLTSGKKSAISETLAKLIESCYGFSAKWVQTGVGSLEAKPPPGFELHVELIHRIMRMNNRELRNVLAFVETLDGLRDRELTAELKGKRRA